MNASLPAWHLGLCLTFFAFMPAGFAQVCPDEPVIENYTGFAEIPAIDLVAGDEWGVVFDEIPADHYPIEVMRIGFGLEQVSGSATMILHDSLRIYPAGLPDPGVAQFVFPDLDLFVGGISLYDFGSVPNTPGQDRIVTQGPFTITYRLQQSVSVTGGAPVHDGNGCQPGRNVRFCAGGPCSGWVDACTLGLGGDWRVQITYRRVNCAGDGTGVEFCTPVPDNNGFCGTCPCLNTPVTGGSGGCVNSELRSCHLTASGAASATSDTLRFEAIGATSASTGILFSGDNRLPIAPFCPGGSGINDGQLDGLRCVGGAALRHGVRISDGAGSFGVTTAGWGVPDPPVGGLVGFSGFMPGQVRHFQLFYRDDENASCGLGVNTSNAVSILFTP